MWHRQPCALLKVDPGGAKIAVERAGLVNQASIVVMESTTEESEILRSLKDVDFSQWLHPGARFGVKVTRVERESTPIDVDALQSVIGSAIWQALNGKVKVDLTSPDILFMGVILGDRFYFGPHLAFRDRVGLFQRRSPLRPFFVPSAINPKIARVMVNLSHATSGSRFLDPFCGTGGLLLEAADIGCVPIGLDIDPAILTGCGQNMQHYHFTFNGMLGDARAPPLRDRFVDAIATDPPYGRSSSTKGSKVVSLVQSSLTSLADVLKPNKYLCVALPFKYFTEEIIPSDAFRIRETHSMRIHRSLKRFIIVLQRK
ncbi:MAG: THUMP domain-containing protein [Candidatus Hodarchaeota archaeon]